MVIKTRYLLLEMLCKCHTKNVIKNVSFQMAHKLNHKANSLTEQTKMQIWLSYAEVNN